MEELNISASVFEKSYFIESFKKRLEIYDSNNASGLDLKKAIGKLEDEIFSDDSLMAFFNNTNGTSDETTVRSFEIITNLLRPVLRIKNDDYIVMPNMLWSTELENFRHKIKPNIPSVGRIEPRNSTPNTFIGTAWFITTDIIVTNFHVLEAIKRLGINLKIRLDTKEESGIMPERNFNIHIDETLNVPRNNAVTNLDIAFLRVENADNIRPIKLAENINYDALDLIAIIGYPKKFDTQKWATVFGNVSSGKKHLQPGLINTDNDNEFEHDCSTANGNSGSVVIDVKTGEAIGLHFGNRNENFNSAIKAEKIRELAANHLGLTI